MNFRLCVLASGSSGNCVLASTDETTLLIDAGLSGRETARRLAAAGVDPERISGICVTHEHIDHTRGVAVMNQRHRIPLYANSGTVDGYLRMPNSRELPWNVFTTGTAFAIGDISVEPFSVPHDAYDPVGYVLSAGRTRVGVVTDMGMPTHLIREKLRDCDALVLESNHDELMLKQSARPWSLKSRISGRHGHLSNRLAAELLAELGGARLRRVYLAHISRDCNRHELALAETRGSLHVAGHRHVEVVCAYPDRISEIWTYSPGA
ncbi:MAG: MBL fold metallo-hydrolase [Kiritimatiellae bacterium]|nr:MBL fold metallo-hydrolase [Kiritimatiellia bacterium]